MACLMLQVTCYFSAMFDVTGNMLLILPLGIIIVDWQLVETGDKRSLVCLKNHVVVLS